MERDKDKHASLPKKEVRDDKNASSRKKKGASGKKSKKKRSKKELQNAQLESDSAGLGASCSSPIDGGDQSERLEKKKEVNTAERDNEVGGDNDEQFESQHSMSRSRSGSRNRFSSLFRRKKRCKSETDLRKQKADTKNEEGVEESKRGKRHVSVEDLKRKQQHQKDESASLQPLKSSLKQSSPYREFSPKTQPRDRLQHMTIREVAKEQRQRRSESVPRRRREYISFDDRDDNTSNPASASNFPDSAVDSADNSQVNPHTLPRNSRNASLTPQHSLNNSSIVSSPSNNIGSSPSSLTSRENTTGHLHHPSDGVMESSQDSGVVVLGQRQLKLDSATDVRPQRKEKSQMEKLLELKQNFPHAFSYGSENDSSANIEKESETEQPSPKNSSTGKETKKQSSDKENTNINSNSNRADLHVGTPDKSLTPSSENNTDDNKNKQNVNQSVLELPVHQRSPTDSSTTAPHTGVQNTTLPSHEAFPSSKITSSPSFLTPCKEVDGSSRGSSRVTSMSSSHRSSDLGYVEDDGSIPYDDDDDEDDDDDNSAFSTPPEDLVSESHKHKTFIHPELLEKYLSNVIQNNTVHDMSPPEIDIYDIENDKKVYPNATLPSSSRKIKEPYQTYEVRKAGRNLKRSSSDVIDRRHKTQPKNYSGAMLDVETSTQTKTPTGSMDTLSDMYLGTVQSLDKNLPKVNVDADEDRASLTSTATLTHLDGKSHDIHASSPETCINREERTTDTKSVPVMGTTAQSIYRRNFSPLRSRKVFSLDQANTQGTQMVVTPQTVQHVVPKTKTNEDNLRSASFQPISSPEDVSIHFPPIRNVDEDNDNSLGETFPGDSSDLQKHDTPTSMKTVETMVSRDIHDDEAMECADNGVVSQAPTFFITGLELQRSKPMSKNINSLMDCLNNQSIIAHKPFGKGKTTIKGKQVEMSRTLSSSENEQDLKDLDEKQQKTNVEEDNVNMHETKRVSCTDKECQTPPWLLDDLIALKTDSNKKSKGILGRRKKQPVTTKPLLTLQTSNKAETLDLPSNSVSPSTASTEDGVFVTPTSAGSNDSGLILRLDAPISPEPDVSNISLSPSSSKSVEVNDQKASDSSKQEELPSGPSKEATAKPTPSKSKPLSLSAVILLKNRIAKYREKKKEKKDSAAGKKLEEEEKAEPESPSDTFMTIENEINLSKLEVSRETDILDAEYFEPEFSLDYSKKQIRFEDNTSNEPVQSEEPLPPLPATATRRLRQRRESTMREKRRKCLSYCKRFVAFLFSHIGLCSLVVAYTILGGFIFQALESKAETAVKTDIMAKRSHVLGQIISMAIELEKSEEGVHNLTSQVNQTLLKWQEDIHHATKDQGWDGTEKTGNEGVWSFASSLLYAITVTTTIGYGHVAPKTPEGRLVTIGYAVVGIPLTLLCLTNIGDVMATGFRLLYGKVCCGICCTMFKPRRRRIPPDLEKGLGRTMITSEKEESDKPKEVIHVPTSLCLLLIAAYIFAGAMLFSMWENWDILTGSYFCFITLSTIGFGDIVPGMETNAWSGEEKLVLCALYLVLGLSLIAMCFNLVQEDVKTKCRWLGMKLGIVDKPETPM